ncbi:hypothetical protein BDV95DRAFT_32097 [Massariosphaeria phaeospora]|uniref:Uncharacterized protein n=1 Tax=Massariosphaeria phaeospora TaxID=100035 RepID=A0A7C8ML66_9PLEO|nr:hypothetical protein BDV95DRAFT_32097 [Massariosphaeria phaeospora]
MTHLPLTRAMFVNSVSLCSLASVNIDHSNLNSHNCSISGLPNSAPAYDDCWNVSNPQSLASNSLTWWLKASGAEPPYT